MSRSTKVTKLFIKTTEVTAWKENLSQTQQPWMAIIQVYGGKSRDAFRDFTVLGKLPTITENPVWSLCMAPLLNSIALSWVLSSHHGIVPIYKPVTRLWQNAVSIHIWDLSNPCFYCITVWFVLCLGSGSSWLLGRMQYNGFNSVGRTSLLHM